MFHQKNSIQDMMRKWVHCHNEAANHQLPIAVAFWIIHGEMFNLNAKCDADSLLYLLRYFECDSHTVDMLTQQHLLSSLTRTVKSSLLMRAHSSPLSLAARVHLCCINHSHYINNGWTYAGRPRSIHICTLYTVYIHTICVFYTTLMFTSIL